jgi:predicted transcriptional regulator
MQIPQDLIVSKPKATSSVKLSGRAYIYARVSTKEQAADGWKRATEWFKKHGV